MIRNGCPLCGTEGHACGQPFTGTPFDLPRTETRVMAEVKRYRVKVNGTETVLKLNAKDAKNYEDATLADEASDDADTEASTESVDEGAADTGEKATKPANKARTAQNKSRTRGTTRNN
jgi:hypothetical protein